MTPAPAPSPKLEPVVSKKDDPPESASPRTVETSTVVSEGSLSIDDVRERFVERVIPRTSRSAQLLLRSAKVEALDGLLLTIAVPSEEMRQNTELIAQGLKGALEHEFKVPMTVFWTVDASLGGAPAPTRRVAPKPALIEDELDDAEESVLVVDSVADHLITEMFPGAEEIS